MDCGGGGESRVRLRENFIDIATTSPAPPLRLCCLMGIYCFSPSSGFGLMDAPTTHRQQHRQALGGGRAAEEPLPAAGKAASHCQSEQLHHSSACRLLQLQPEAELRHQSFRFYSQQLSALSHSHFLFPVSLTCAPLYLQPHGVPVMCIVGTMPAAAEVHGKKR